MKKTAQTTIYSVSIEKEVVTEFTDTCRANGLRQGFVLAKLIQLFKNDITIIYRQDKTTPIEKIVH